MGQQVATKFKTFIEKTLRNISYNNKTYTNKINKVSVREPSFSVAIYCVKIMF